MKKEVAEFAKGKLQEISSNPNTMAQKFPFNEKSEAEEFSEMGVSASELMENEIREMYELITRMTKGEQV